MGVGDVALVQCEASSNRLQKLEVELQTVHSQVGEARGRVAELEGKLCGMERKLADAEAEASAEEALATQAYAALERVEAELESARAQLASLKAGSLEDGVCVALESAAAKEMVSAAAMQELEVDLAQVRAELTSELAEAEAELSVTSKQLEQLKLDSAIDIDNLHSTIKSVTEQNTSMEFELEVAARLQADVQQELAQITQLKQVQQQEFVEFRKKSLGRQDELQEKLANIKAGRALEAALENQILELRAKKASALESEDYDTAKQIKGEIDSLAAQIEEQAAAAILCEEESHQLINQLDEEEEKARQSLVMQRQRRRQQQQVLR